MAITESLGYGGPLDENDVPQWRTSFAGTYGVVDEAAWKVTIKPAVDRTVTVAAGVGYGHGVIDTNGAPVDVGPLDALASGTRYDLIVAHRDWSGTGGTTTFDVVTGTSSQTAAFASRDQTPGDVDDQPLAVVRVTGNGAGGVIAEVTPIRCWQANGGAYAEHSLALQYLTEVATEVRIGAQVWSRTIDSSGNAAWSPSTPVLQPLTMFGAGFAGITQTAAPTSATTFLVQADSTPKVTNSASQASIIFPTAFPNGLITVFLSGGDDAGNPDFSANPLSSTYTKSGFTYRVWGSDGMYLTTRSAKPGLSHILNWIALGW